MITSYPAILAEESFCEDDDVISEVVLGTIFTPKVRGDPREPTVWTHTCRSLEEEALLAFSLLTRLPSTPDFDRRRSPSFSVDPGETSSNIFTSTHSVQSSTTDPHLNRIPMALFEEALHEKTSAPAPLCKWQLLSSLKVLGAESLVVWVDDAKGVEPNF